jgi:two-component SAPR family response regulator
VFGRLQVRTNPDPDAGTDIGGALSDRRRELLIYLATHPAGARRDLITAELWATSTVDQPTGLLHSAISRLRAALARHTSGAAVILGPEDDHYRLAPQYVDVDYWRFDAAATTHRTARTDMERADAARHIITIYQAELAPALTPSSPWAQRAQCWPPRTARPRGHSTCPCQTPCLSVAATCS